MNKKIAFILYVIGYILIIVSTLLFVFQKFFGLVEIIPYIFCAGVLVAIIGRVFTLPKADDFRKKRLNTMLAIAAVLLLASAYFILKNNHAFIITLIITAFIDLFTAIRYPENKM